MDPGCCHCCDGWTGYGGNFFCYGGVCCAPHYVASYSRTVSQVGFQNAQQKVIIVQQPGQPMSDTQRTGY